MQRFRLASVLLVSAALWACAPPRSPALTVVQVGPSPTSEAVPSGVAACYYVWTSQELPALSQVVQSGMQQVAAGGSGGAYAYGEDCVAADGTRAFTPMETDFTVSLPATDLKDEEQLGNLMAAAMRVIDLLPKDQLVGPRPGRVQFFFHAGTADSPPYTVEIERYLREGAGLNGVRFFRLFRSAP